MIRVRGLKQGWIAEQLGLTDPAFSLIVRGKAALPAEKIRPLAGLLRVSIAEIRRTQDWNVQVQEARRLAREGAP